MIKIFPFYKGKNIANNEFGYTTVANARKRMDHYDVRKDFNATLPIDYWIDHSYVMRLENPWKEDYGRRWGLDVAHGYYGVEYTTEGYTKGGSQTYLKDLPSDIFDLFVRLAEYESKADNSPSFEDIEENREKYKEILFKILKKGWRPTIWKDTKDYDKKYRKFVKDNVEFREMEVIITPFKE